MADFKSHYDFIHQAINKPVHSQVLKNNQIIFQKIYSAVKKALDDCHNFYCWAYVAQVFESYPNEIRHFIVLMYNVVTFEHAGKHFYHITKSLAEKLKATQIKGLLTDDIKLPYKSIYISLPEDFSMSFWIMPGQSGSNNAWGIYVTEDPGDGSYSRTLRFNVSSKPEAVNYNGELLYDDNTSFCRIYLEPGKLLEQAIIDSMIDAPSEESKNTWKNILHWTTNLILYITWYNPGEHWERNVEAKQLWERIQKLPKGIKRSKLLERYKNIDKQSWKMIDESKSTVIQRRSLNEDTKNFNTKILDLPGTWKEISGFWRRQRFGKNLEQQRQQWIEPHWRRVHGTIKVGGYDVK